MSKWLELEKGYSGTFNRQSSFCYLFSDTFFLKRIEDFNPERQWNVACGILFKEDGLRRYFTSIIGSKDNFLNIIIPTNTFYDQFYIYDHEYIENEEVEIFWRDMFYSYSFKEIIDKDLESSRKYMATRGLIVKQTETHILFHVEKYLQTASNHKSIKDEFRYLSIPKSYIRNIKKVGGDWQVSSLKKITPKIDNLILEGKISLDRIRKECDTFSKKYKNKKSFLAIKDNNSKKVEYGIDFSYLALGFEFKYTGNISFNFLNRINPKYFLKRVANNKYMRAHTE